MATNTNIVDGTTGGTNTRVIRVIPQTTLNSDSTINAAANKGYTLTSSTLQTINLPTPCIPGDVFALHGVGTGLFKIVQKAGEQITLGDTSSTLGVSGFIDSTRTGDELYLLCIDAAGLWKNDGGWGGQLLVDGTTLVDTTNNVGGVPVTLSSTGTGGTDLVTSGTSPALTIARINATIGVSGSFVSGVYTIINTAPDQTVVLTSPAGNITFGGTYPALTGDVDNLAISALADATAGEIPTWSAGGVATTVATGTSTHVLTSNGAGTAPTFQDVVSGGDVTLTGTGTTGVTLVSDGAGPALSVKKVEAGDGVEITEVDGTLVFSSTGGGTLELLDTQVFTANGTWTKPVNAKVVNVLLIGGGGGGGSGAREASSGHTGGVGGTYGSVTAVDNYPSDLLGASVGVTIGAGGTGAPGQTVNTSSGITGDSGGDTIFDVFEAKGADGGDGGSTLFSDVTFSGTVLSSTIVIYARGQIASVTDDTFSGPIDASSDSSQSGTVPNIIGQLCPSSGGPGQSTSSSTLRTLHPGNAIEYEYLSEALAQAAAAAAGNPGNNGVTYSAYYGSGASGGAGSNTAGGFAGGNGGDYGGGGGGGGCSDNGFTSGAGGNGGPGVAVINTYG